MTKLTNPSAKQLKNIAASKAAEAAAVKKPTPKTTKKASK